MKDTYDFRRDILRSLMDNNHMTANDLSKITDVSISSIRNYLSGKTLPTVSALIAFSSALNVPMELLTGQMDDMIEDRCTYLKNCANGLRTVNSKFFSTDTYFKKAHYSNVGYELPYPINLYNDIGILDGSMKIELPVTKDQMNGLEKAMADSLTSREYSFITQYYENGCTLSEIASNHSLTRERIRMIIVSGIRKLRNPNARALILLGIKGSGILKREMELNELEETLREREKILTDRALKINPEFKKIEPEVEREKYLKSITLDDLGFSTRTYTCLRRSNIRSLYALSTMTLEELFAIRHAGKHTVDEIVAVMQKYNISPKEKNDEKS